MLRAARASWASWRPPAFLVRRGLAAPLRALPRASASAGQQRGVAAWRRPRPVARRPGARLCGRLAPSLRRAPGADRRPGLCHAGHGAGARPPDPARRPRQRHRCAACAAFGHLERTAAVGQPVRDRLAYTIRFLAGRWARLEAGFERLSPNLDMAARTLGGTPLRTLARAHAAAAAGMAPLRLLCSSTP